MKIEGEWLVFSSGRKEFAEDGLVSLDLDVDIKVIGLNDHLGVPELTDQEKWELARYMIERWMDVRDKLWARHEDTMREEPMEGGYCNKERECIHDTCGITCSRKEATTLQL